MFSSTARSALCNGSKTASFCESLLSQLNATTGDTFRLQIGIVLNFITVVIEAANQTAQRFNDSHAGGPIRLCLQRQMMATAAWLEQHARRLRYLIVSEAYRSPFIKILSRQALLILRFYHRTRARSGTSSGRNVTGSTSYPRGCPKPA